MTPSPAAAQDDTASRRAESRQEPGADDMWTAGSALLPLTDRIDATRTDLLERFDRDPLAIHNLELQVLVSGIRQSARLPRIVLSRVDHGRWLVTEIGAGRPGRPRILSPRVFDDQREAERFVFNHRLALLAALDDAETPSTEARP